MSYKLNKNQNHLEKSFTRFDFYFKHKGIQHRKTEVCRKSAVEAIYRDWQDEILNSGNPKIMLFEIIEQYLIDIKQFKTASYCKAEERSIARLKEFLKENIPLEKFRRKHVAEFITWRRSKVFAKFENTQIKGKVSNATINRDIAVISYFFNWCIKRELYLAVNPASMSKLKENNVREVRLSQSQIELLIKKAYDINLITGHVICIALMTGMRKKEILSLEWSEVNFDGSFILLSATKTKSKRARVIPLIGDLRRILLEIQNDKMGLYIFESYTSDILRKHWIKLLRQISFNTIKNGSSLHFHDLRHVYAQSLLDQGVGLEDIQSLLGHEDINTTQKRYAMFARPDLKEKAERISNVFKFQRAI